MEFLITRGIIMLVLKYDLEMFDIDEVHKICEYIKKILPNELVIAIPKGCDLYRIDNQKKDFVDL